MSTDILGVTLDRLPPCNPEAEEAVLASCLMDADAVLQVISVLKPGDFYRDKNRAIYAALCDMHQQRNGCVDMLTLADELRRRGEWEMTGGYVYLNELLGAVPTFRHIEEYAAIVIRTAINRRLISAAGRIAGLAWGDTLSPEETMTKAFGFLSEVALGNTRDRVWSPADQAAHLYEWAGKLAERGTTGMPTGFTGLDHITGGLQPGDFVVVLGDTGLGKSAWGQSVGRNVARNTRQGGPVLDCTLEMTELQVTIRNAAALMRFPATEYLSGWREFARQIAAGENVMANGEALGKAAALIEGMPFFIYDVGEQTVETIRAKALQMQATTGLALVEVDYLQLVTGPKSESRIQEVSAISRRLKRLAKELKVPVVTFSQIPREVIKGRQDKRPTLHDARESGAIEQDADIVLGLYRHDYYYDAGQTITDQGEQVTVRPGQAELIVLKCRGGEAPHTLDMVWLPDTVEYVNAETDPEYRDRRGNDQ